MQNVTNLKDCQSDGKIQTNSGIVILYLSSVLLWKILANSQNIVSCKNNLHFFRVSHLPQCMGTHAHHPSHKCSCSSELSLELCYKNYHTAFILGCGLSKVVFYRMCFLRSVVRPPRLSCRLNAACI